MSAPACHTCGLGFAPNEDAYASDWTVIDLDGSTRMVTRYQHITCPSPEPWRCELHNIVTTGDCSACDDEMIEATR